MSNVEKSRCQILTIGHSNLAIGGFVELLAQFRVESVVDVRSSPRSRYVPQFDMESLKQSLTESGVLYLYLGRGLGGRPRGDQFYDARGHVDYIKVAETPTFRDGIARLEVCVRQSTTAVLCAEEDPSNCHRRLLVGRILSEHGIQMEHIRADGSLQHEADLVDANDQIDPQLALFDGIQADEWKSIPSVSLKRRQNSFSAY